MQPTPPKQSFELALDPEILGDLRKLVDFSIIALYPRDIKDPIKQSLYLINAEQLAGIMGDTLEALKISTLKTNKDIEFIEDIVSAAYGADNVEQWKDQWKHGKFGHDEYIELAYQTTMRKQREDASSLYRRLKYVAGINKAVSNGHSLKAVQARFNEIRDEIKGENIVELKDLIEDGMILLDGEAPEVEIEDSPEAIEEHDRMLEQNIKEFYKLLELNGSLASVENFTKDIQLVEEIFEGAKDYATIEIDDPSRLIEEAERTFKENPKVVYDHVAKRLAQAMQNGFDSSKLSEDVKKQVESLLESNPDLKEKFDEYHERLRRAEGLADLAKRFRKALGHYSFAVLRSETKEPYDPLFIVDMHNIPNLSVREAVSIKDMIEVAKQREFDRIRNFYTTFLRSSKVESRIEEKIDEAIDFALLHSRKMGSGYKPIVNGKLSAFIPTFRSLLLDDDLRRSIIAIDPNIIIKGILSKEKVDESKLTDEVLNSLLELSEPIQEQMKAFSEEVDHEKSKLKTEGVRGKTPREIYLNALSEETKDRSFYEDTLPWEKVVRYIALYKAIECVSYGTSPPSELLDLEKKITELTHGVHPSEFSYKAEKKYFKKLAEADNKVYEAKKSQLTWNSFPESVLKMMYHIQKVVDDRKEQINAMLEQGFNHDKKEGIRKITILLNHSIDQYLRTDDDAMAHGLDAFFSGVQNKTGYLVRASSHALSVIEDRRKGLSAKQHHQRDIDRQETTSTLSTMTSELKKARETYAKLSIVYLEIQPGK